MSASLKLLIGFPKLVQVHLFSTAVLKNKGAASTHCTLTIGTECQISEGPMVVMRRMAFGYAPIAQEGTEVSTLRTNGFFFTRRLNHGWVGEKFT